MKCSSSPVTLLPTVWCARKRGYRHRLQLKSTTDDTGNVTPAADNEAAYKAQKDAEQAKSVRTTRDTKLAETDWRFRSDMTPSQEWKNYCQALRDVPTQEGFPWTIVWPTQPE
jgi:hypothetical protein